MKTPIPFVSLAKKFFESDPVIVARHLETMPADEVMEVFKSVSPSLAVEVFKQFHDSTKATLAERLPQDFFVKFIHSQCLTYLHISIYYRYDQ